MRYLKMSEMIAQSSFEPTDEQREEYAAAALAELEALLSISPYEYYDDAEHDIIAGGQ